MISPSIEARLASVEGRPPQRTFQCKTLTTPRRDRSVQRGYRTSPEHGERTGDRHESEGREGEPWSSYRLASANEVHQKDRETQWEGRKVKQHSECRIAVASDEADERQDVQTHKAEVRGPLDRVSTRRTYRVERVSTQIAVRL